MALGQAQRPIESDDPTKKAHFSGPAGDTELHVHVPQLLAEQQKTNELLTQIRDLLIAVANE